MNLKTIETLLNIASYALIAMISVTIIKIGIKVFKLKSQGR